MPKELAGYIIHNTLELKKFNTSSTRLTIAILIISFVMLVLTAVLALQSAYDMPNYPWRGYKVIPTETYSYIDTKWGDNVIYETDYTIKYSKWLPPRSYGFSIKLPIIASGFIEVMNVIEPRDMPIEWADASNGTVRIENVDKINPILLRIEYTSGEKIDPDYLVHQMPLLDIQNDSIMLDSFYLKVENMCGHDIKTLRLNSNVTRWVDRNLPELKNTSWTDQRVMIYDRGLPVDDSRIDERGIVIWNVDSIKPHEQKVYYFKKVKST